MAKGNLILLPFTYCLILISLLLYSFTQIDLNLTLSKASMFQDFQKFFIQIGYFQRPLSTVIFLIIISFLFIFYALILRLANQNKISKSQAWLFAGLSVAILLFSYPAFSHDLFNYLFDARIFTYYQLSPYHFKPLDFPFDSWTRFMHWTHRNYPYGPSWLILTIPFSYLGFGKFLLTLLNFKILIAAGYMGTIYLIGKILEKINPSISTLGMIFFALNPLVLIESLVSAHHDVVMILFALLAVYLILVGKKIYSFFSFLISIGVKFVTASLLPLLIFGFQPNLAIIFAILGFIYVATKIEIQPWYFIWVLPFIALNPRNRFFTFLSFGFSFGLLLRYTPFLYLGNWNDPAPQIKVWVTIVPTAIALLIFLICKIQRKRASKQIS